MPSSRRMFQQTAGNAGNGDGRSRRRSSVKRVGPPRHRMQQRSNRRRCKFAPFDAHAFPIAARHIGLYDDSLMSRPRVREQSDLEPAFGSNQYRGLYVSATDAQIGQPAVSFRKGMRHEPNRKIDLYPFAPAVIHEFILPRRRAPPYKKSLQLRRDNSYSRASIPRQHPRSQRMISTASRIADEQVRSKSTSAPSTIHGLCISLRTSTKLELKSCMR